MASHVFLMQSLNFLIMSSSAMIVTGERFPGVDGVLAIQGAHLWNVFSVLLTISSQNLFLFCESDAGQSDDMGCTM